MMIDTSRDLDMFATSDILDESRALEEYPPIERNPMVPSMARIVMTTISSMRVKPLNFWDLMRDTSVEEGCLVWAMWVW